MRQFIDPSIESNVFAVPSPTHKGSINGRRLVPQSFGLRPPTGGYDSSDLLRRSQTMCIRNMDPSYHLLCRGHKRCVSAIWILRITSSAEVTNDVYPQYGSFVSPPAEVTNDVYSQYGSFVSPPLRRSQTMCIRNMDPSYHLLCGGHYR